MPDLPTAALLARDPPRLELVCLGPPRARVEGQDAPDEIVGRKPLGLLIYLALSPSCARTREHLVGLFWPEQPEARARHALNETIRRLRRSLGAHRLLSRGVSLTLNDAGLDVDALRFDAAAERDATQALPLLRGDFLEGFTVDGAPAFEEWAAAERERYRARAASLLLAEGESQLAACRFAEARDAARRALAVQPYAEPAARVLMRTAVLSGDSAGALAIYHEFCRTLADGIGEQPSRELTALGERIRQHAWRPAAVTEAEREPPLVGRESIHRETFALIAAGLTDGPLTLMITGAPGMGRTRLLTECIERLALEGAVVALARPLPSDLDAPWSTLRLLMRAGLHRAPGLVATHADALGVLAGLVPELADRSPPREPRDAAHVAAALAAALGAITEEKPVGLAVDDAHLADGATLGALFAAVEQLHAAPVILVITAPDHSENAPRELLQLRGEIGRRLRGTSVRLDPLSADDMRELVSALAPWCRDDSERDRLARRLAVETGGNPFFAITLLGGLQRLSTLREDFVMWPRPQATFDTPLPISVPDLARVAIAARVAELDEESRRVLTTASIGGLALDLDLIATLAELSRPRVEDKLAAPERHHLVLFDGERYAFTAPLIAEVVRSECLTAGQRQSLRKRAIAALAARSDLEARVLRAELMAAVEPGRPAFEEAVAVARAALAAGSGRTARRAVAAAERAAGGQPGSEQSLLDELLAQIGR